MAEKENPALEEAIEMLTKDHDDVSDMFREYKKLMDLEASAAKRKSLADQICQALTEHADMEETIFYPAARRHLKKDNEEIMDHADVEHASLKRLVEEISAEKASSKHFDAKVHVLCEYVSHHVEEEEFEMFSELRKADPSMTATLKKMKEFKGE